MAFYFCKDNTLFLQKVRFPIKNHYKKLRFPMKMGIEKVRFPMKNGCRKGAFSDCACCGALKG